MSFLRALFHTAKEEKKEPKIAFDKIKGGGELPIGDWKRVSPLLSVQGIQFRREAAVQFSKLILAASRRYERFGLLLEREPNNMADRNAVKVIGRCATTELHIGYVDRVEAAELEAHFPNAQLAAEFYSLYRSQNDYIDIRFYVNVPRTTIALPGHRATKLLHLIADELAIMNFVVMADHRRSRAETDLLNKYILARAEDLKFDIFEEDVSEILSWLKTLANSEEEVALAVERVVDGKKLSVGELSDLLEIFVGVDGKVTSSEKKALEFLSLQLNQSNLSN